MSHTAESIAKVLKEIQDSVPPAIRNRIVKKAEMTPTIKKIAKEALADGATKQELKDKLKILLDSGELDKPKYIQDDKYAKMADEIVKRGINKAIKEGRLPRKADIQKLLKDAKNNR